MARRELAKRGAGVTLGATTLLHEAYLDISEREGRRFPIATDSGLRVARHARAHHRLRARRQAQKRGGEFEIDLYCHRRGGADG